MPLSIKIQPIDSLEEQVGQPPLASAPRPLVKSRLRRLFRISSGAGGVDESTPDHCCEPSSVCLAKMVQNFIEENNEKQQQSVKCGRSRCNCFNGGSDCSDTEPDSLDAADFLKSLVASASVNERNVLADTSKIVEKNSKVCKRKDDMRKAVVEGLTGLGYDACVCKSKWEKSSAFPAGEYEYIDVITAGNERLIIDVDFRSEFEIARSTKTYKSILQTLPSIFVGKSDRLRKIIAVVSKAVKQSLNKKGMDCPPWRKAEYFEAKWLCPRYARALPPQLEAYPLTTPVVELKPSGVGLTVSGKAMTKLVSGESLSAEDREEADGDDGARSCSIPDGEQGDRDSLFAMSESSCGEEEVEFQF